ncbi:DUF6055 domain-containing protein [Pedobacter sp. MC2016-05]|uniref:DUF6055 domain-containing protein n=1 Tax=Pedobacter sp. MC2016-05 TaxID=2994474 RepID=UPI002248288D|nr:DUF6055 domain-containing protein [Pedobacter sp. MC2016-05]MCX2473765.1 DUF6055 domain-containing protein [Pedobacter sp. MC2016-05]
MRTTRYSIALLLALLLNYQKSVAQEKEIYFPSRISTVPANNDFTDNGSEYSNKRSAQSTNFVVYWAKEYGDQPLENQDINKRFDIKQGLAELERYYNFYIEELHVLKKGKSVSDRYKILFFITGGKNQTAYGWGADDKVGILWSPASRINKQPYGVLAHELGHVFQFLAGCDNGGVSFNGPVNEMGAQYLLWQVYPDWLNFENYHLKAYLKNTFHAFLHPENQYRAPFVIEYWAEKHGKDFYGKLLSSVKKDEDPVQTYERITQTNQKKFNDEMFEACSKLVTFDLKRIERIASKYADLNRTPIKGDENGWESPDSKYLPENYGYNAIKLELPSKGSKISIQFDGKMNKTNSNSKVNKMGWRYGFVVHKKNGERSYSKVSSKAKWHLNYLVPKEAEQLWLVVMAAPDVHTKLPKSIKETKQFSYQFKLGGTAVLKEDLN